MLRTTEQTVGQMAESICVICIVYGSGEQRQGLKQVQKTGLNKIERNNAARQQR